jgi:hypothetical protein
VSDESPGAPPRYWALVSIRPIEGLPVTAEFSRKPPPPRQPIAWPAATTEDALDNAIVACQIEDLDAYQDLSFHVLFWPDIAGSLWWQGSLPPPEIAFDPAGKHYAAHLVLFDLPASAGEMLLHTGASFYRREGPWDAHPYATDTAHPPLARIPYAWNTVEGFLLPLLGEDFTFGCAVQGNWAHLANPKENLARLLVEEAPPVQAHPAFRARIRWHLLGPAISSALRQRQQLGQLPGDPRAFDADYGCWTDAVKALGTAQLASVDDAAPEMFTVRGELALRKGDAP